jgi:hypothetical protein
MMALPPGRRWRSGCEKAYTQTNLHTGNLAPASGICNRVVILFSLLLRNALSLICRSLPEMVMRVTEILRQP